MLRYSTPRKGKGKKGFTLIELLAVILIIVVLVALSLGGFRKVTDNALRAKCAGNLRQLGVLATTYAIDHNGNLPLIYDLRLGVNGEPSPGLIDLLGSYANGDYRAFYCSDAPHCVPKPYYAASMTFNWQAAQTSQKFNYIGYYWLISTSPYWNAGGFESPQKTIGSSMRVMATCPHFDGGYVHNRLYNVLFTDGRVETRKADSNGSLINYIDQSTLQFVPPYK